MCPDHPNTSGQSNSIIYADFRRRARLTNYLGVPGRRRTERYSVQGDTGILGGWVNNNKGVTLMMIADGTSNTLLIGERPPGPSETGDWGWWAGRNDWDIITYPTVMQGDARRHRSRGIRSATFRAVFPQAVWTIRAIRTTFGACMPAEGTGRWPTVRCNSFRTRFSCRYRSVINTQRRRGRRAVVGKSASPQRFTILGFAMLASMTFLAGCGTRQTQVSGTITFDDRPLAPGTVMAVGSDGEPRTAEIDDSSEYAIDSLPVGRHHMGGHLSRSQRQNRSTPAP